MNKLSDDESSDSSSEFLVPINKIDLNSSFFDPLKNKTSLVKPVSSPDSSENSDEDFDYTNENNVSSADLLSQVLKNLEHAKEQTFKTDINHLAASTSKKALNTSNNIELSEEISNLLKQGESGTAFSIEDNDEKDVDDDYKSETKIDYTIPDKGVEIHLPGTNVLYDWKKRKQQDLQKLLQSKINQRIRSTQVYMHKVGLLVWLTHGFFLNKLANDTDLLGTALSLVSSTNYPKGRIDLNYLEKFTIWFQKMFQICEEHKEVVYSKDSLMKNLLDKKIHNYVELVLLYIITMRGMGMNCRLVISLYPPSLKPRPEELFKIPIDNATNDNETSLKEEKIDEEKEGKIKQSRKLNKKIQNKAGKSKDKSKHEKSISPIKIIPENSKEGSKAANLKAKEKALLVLKQEKPVNLSTSVKEIKPDQMHKEIMKRNSNKNITVNNVKHSCNDEEVNIADNSNTIARKLRSRVNKHVENIKSSNTNKNKEKLIQQSKDMETFTKRKYSSSHDSFSEKESNFSTDDEYVEKKPKSRIQKNITIKKEQNHQSRKQRKLLSSDDEMEVEKFYNIWIEVYVESEESWISVNIMDKKIHCVSEIYKKAKHPVLYVVAWNSAGTMKDVTRRYCPHWLTDTRKKRVDEKWWYDTLYSWKEKKTAISKAEDEGFLQSELEQPLPKTISECKGHPLYVLTRHLLKFEALYPPDAVPLGHLKTGEAIYSRHCVHTLYSRETWVKKARVVKPAQEAYKVVKSMPKYDKLSGMKIKNQPLELFGKWQTTPYVPPKAVDGKVPRNEYGNVDLFKMCMLPEGTAYINLPALNRVARKLNIDCAPACVGFNFGCRGALPAFEGFVVCEEFEDTLRQAWEQEQIESQKRAKEKREKRIYGNWKKLIKGLLIRMRLTEKYNFCDEEENINMDTEKEKNVTIKKRPNITTKKSTTKTLKRSKQDSSNIKKKIKK